MKWTKKIARNTFFRFNRPLFSTTAKNIGKTVSTTHSTAVTNVVVFTAAKKFSFQRFL